LKFYKEYSLFFIFLFENKFEIFSKSLFSKFLIAQMIDSGRIKLLLENYKHLKIAIKSIFNFIISALWRSVAALKQAVHLKQLTHVEQSSLCRINVRLSMFYTSIYLYFAHL